MKHRLHFQLAFCTLIAFTLPACEKSTNSSPKETKASPESKDVSPPVPEKKESKVQPKPMRMPPTKGKIDTSGPEFEVWLKAFVAELRSGDKARQKKAAMLFGATPEEIKIVFPRSGPKAAEMAEAALAKITDAQIDDLIELLMKDYGQPGPIKVSELRDLRKDPQDDERVKKALKEMLPDVPFIHAAFDQGNFGNSGTYYMRVNGRWAYLDSLKGLIELDDDR